MSEIAIESSAVPRAGETIKTRWSAVDLALLLVVLVAAIGFRCHAVERSLTYDELWHLGLSTGRGSPVGQLVADRIYLDPPQQTSLDGAPPFYQIWTHMDGVLHPPLYVITLRLWRDAFGGSDVAARSYSMVWSLVAIGFVFAAVRLATGRSAAGLVALAMAIAPTQVYLATTVRGYEMLLGLGSIAVWLMMRIEGLGVTGRRAISLAAILFPLLLTHYFAAGAALAIAAYGFVCLRERRIAFTVTLAIVASVYAVVWLPFAIRQSYDINTGDAFLHVSNFNAWHEAIAVFAVPGRLLVDSPQTIWWAGGIGALLFVAAMFIWSTGRQRAIAPLVLWSVGSIGFIAALDLTRSTRHALFIRYFAIATPAVFALVVVTGRAIGRRLDIIAGAALLVAAIAMPQPAGWVMNDSADYTAIADALSRVAARDEAVLLWRSTGTTDFSDSVFIHLSHKPGLFPRPVMKIEVPLSPEAIAELPHRVWLVMPLVDTGAMPAMFPGASLLETEEVPFQARLIHMQFKLPNAAGAP